MANKAAISHARVRLGPEPMALLFERVAKPLAAKDTSGVLVGRAASGRHRWDLSGPAGHTSQRRVLRATRVMKGERSAFPQARVVALAECGTHAVFDAVTGPYTTSEAALSAKLLGRLTPGMLCLAVRGSTASKRGKTLVAQGLTCSGG